jgi:hypothetical protein
MNAKLRIERLHSIEILEISEAPEHPGSPDAPASPASPESTAAGPQLPPHSAPKRSVRPYFYRTPKGTAPLSKTSPDQRRSTDDDSTGPRIQ